jgi:hypothetical protein
MSSIIGISTINGVAYPPTVATGVQSTITNAGSFVNIDGAGSIFVSTNTSPASDVNVNAYRFVNIEADAINLFAPTHVSSLTVSSINGAPYGIPPSTITNAGSVVNIDGGGSIFISTFSGVDKDINLTAYRYVNVDATLFNCPVNASIPELTSVSSINGAPYKPSTFTEASISSLTVSTINGSQFQTFQGTYYISTAQTLTSGNTDIIFNSTATWNNDGGYIAHTNGTASFTVFKAGLYQLEFNAVVLANGAVYLLTDQGKQVAIDVTRGTEQSVISNTALQASQQNYSMSITGTYYLNTSDILNLRVRNTFTGGPPTVQELANTFDLNTFFTWRFIS